MSTPMNSEHADAVIQLKERLTTIAELEKKVAPKGVSFAMRGQEGQEGIETIISASKCVGVLHDPIAAADAVISVLRDAEALKGEDLDALAARAQRLPAR